MTAWTPKAEQTETWDAIVQPIRVFDPFVFDPRPIYDTSSPAGLWQERPKQSEVWTQV